MANNYLLFSHRLILWTPEQVEWAKEQLEKYEQDGPLFEWCLEEVGGGSHLTMWPEKDAEIEIVEDLLQDYLIKFDPDGYIVLTWAVTCSKMRPGELHGGWCFITATETRWDGECLQQLKKAHEEEMGA